MKASILAKELQNIIENEGDLDIDISVIKQPEITEQQQYLVANARFVVLEEYENEDPKGERIIKRISIRDWSC